MVAVADVGCWLSHEEVDALDAFIDEQIEKRTGLGAVLESAMRLEGRAGARKHCAGAVLSRVLTGRIDYEPPPRLPMEVSL